MPLYMDLHKLQGVTPEALANAHLKDLDVQDKYGVRYLRYWFNEPAGKIFLPRGGAKRRRRHGRPSRGPWAAAG